MIEVKQISSKKDIKKSIKFQLKMYKGNPYYVPPIFIDEVNYLQKHKNPVFETADVAHFVAYKDGKMAGRISGFILYDFNNKVNEKRVRFSRFDCINDVEVSKALFNAVETWAKNKGMEIAHGPLGGNDLDREGLLIEGFDQLNTFASQYSHAYYKDLIEANGYKKEVDWLEFKIFMPDKINERITKISKLVLKRSKLRIAPIENKSKFIDKYKDGIFEVLDAAYAKLYGVVELSEKVREQVVKDFKLILDPRFICVVLNEKDEVVAFGLAMPAIGKALQKSSGKLLPFGIFRLLKAAKRPRDIDLGLIAVKPEYQLTGVNSIVLNEIGSNVIKAGIPSVETNLQLETNHQVQAQFETFEFIQHKRRRSFIKKL